MRWNKKEDKKRLPDIPGPAPYFNKNERISPPFNYEDDEPETGHALPSFPDSPNDKSFSQAAIKDAVSDDFDAFSHNEFNQSPPQEEHSQSLPEEELIPRKLNNPSIMEMEEWSPDQHSNSFSRNNSQVREVDAEHDFNLPQPPTQSIPSPSISPDTIPNIKKGKANEVFVKIDKFHSARRAISDIRDKLEEIDETIKKIRETKMKEEQELSIWEKDLSLLKDKLKAVTDNIFEKI